MRAEPKLPRRVKVDDNLYLNPSNGKYEVQWTERGEVKWKMVGTSEREARQFRDETHFRVGRGEVVAGSSRKLAEVGQEWLRLQHHLRPRTRALYVIAFERHINPRLGQKRIGDITVDHIARLIVDLQETGLSGSTVRGILTPLGGVFSYAARRELVSENPINRLERGERPRIGRREMRVLAREEMEVLLPAVIPSYRPVIATAIFTGLRQGELLGLTWADIDFANDVIHVRCQLDRTGSRTAPKTPQAYRQVMLMPSLAQLLREHKIASAFSAPMDPVFATLGGRPMNYRNVTRRGFAAAVERAELDRPGEPRLRFHDLRHTFASLLVAQGLNVVFISRQLGHASSSFTLDVYSHLFDRAEHARRATDNLEAAFGEMLTARDASAGITEHRRSRRT